MKNVLLFSGGLDSFIAWHYLEKPMTVYGALGHRYMKREIKAITELEQHVPDLDVTIDYTLNLAESEQGDATIPMRNLYLSMLGAKYGHNIYLIVQKGETAIPDRTKQFMLDAGTLLGKLNDKVISISSPFMEMTKVDMVRWYLQKELSIDELLLTRSCYEEHESPCGKCAACIRRSVALNLNGVYEKMMHNPKESELIPSYIERAIKGDLEETRGQEFLQWLDN